MDPRLLLATRSGEEDEPDAGPSSFNANVTSRKLASYNASAPTRKSKLEKDREAAAKKQKEEEEEAARAYAEFVEAFDVDESSVGGVRTDRTKTKGFVRAGGSGSYNPLAEDRGRSSPQSIPAPQPPVQHRPFQSSTSKPPHSRPTPTSSANTLKPAAKSMFDDSVDIVPEQAPKPGAGGRKKRDMDHFLDQLKSQQKEREDRLKWQAGRAGSSVTALAARENAPVLTGSFDAGDPLTTNIHVGNLPQVVNEEMLGMLFAQWGAVGSVKIMWPRVDGSTSIHRGALGGFVAMLRRPDAEVAAKEVDGLEWHGNVLRTSWGKAVPVPPRAIYEAAETTSRHHRDPGRERRRSSRSRSPPRRRRSRSDSAPRSRSRSRSRERGRDREWPQLEASADEPLLRSVAARVREHGRGFEDMLREREKDNAAFTFLYNDKLPSYHFFRMLTDSSYNPPPKVVFKDEGDAEIYSSDSAEDSENDRMRKGRLGRLAQSRFESILRGLTSTREKVARGMTFAIEHADAATTIVDLLIASLTLEATPVPRKIARLHLVSDILHNSAAPLPNAWVYRSTFEARLTEVFDHLGEVYLSFPGRMKAEQFRMQVIKIVDVWEHDWMIFEPGVIEDLKRRLAGEGVSSVDNGDDSPAELSLEPDASVTPEPGSLPSGFKRSGFKTSSFAPSTLTESLPEPKAAEDELLAEGDVDGDEVIDVDGENVDVDGEDVDGDEVPPATTETVVLSDDGEAMELGDSDGEDMF